MRSKKIIKLNYTGSNIIVDWTRPIQFKHEYSRKVLRIDDIKILDHLFYGIVINSRGLCVFASIVFYNSTNNKYTEARYCRDGTVWEAISSDILNVENTP
jgi:hypothetical protein